MNHSLLITRYKHYYSDTLQQISKGCMANIKSVKYLKKTNLRTTYVLLFSLRPHQTVFKVLKCLVSNE